MQDITRWEIFLSNVTTLPHYAVRLHNWAFEGETVRRVETTPHIAQNNIPSLWHWLNHWPVYIKIIERKMEDWGLCVETCKILRDSESIDRGAVIQTSRKNRQEFTKLARHSSGILWDIMHAAMVSGLFWWLQKTMTATPLSKGYWWAAPNSRVSLLSYLRPGGPSVSCRSLLHYWTVQQKLLGYVEENDMYCMSKKRGKN